MRISFSVFSFISSSISCDYSDSFTSLFCYQWREYVSDDSWRITVFFFFYESPALLIGLISVLFPESSFDQKRFGRVRNPQFLRCRLPSLWASSLLHLSRITHFSVSEIFSSKAKTLWSGKIFPFEGSFKFPLLQGHPSKALKIYPSRLHLLSLPPSLVIDTLQFDSFLPPKKSWSLNCFFFFLFFFIFYCHFYFYFLTIFVSVLFFLIAEVLVFLFSPFWIDCVLFFLWQDVGTKLCASFRVGVGGWGSKSRKSGGPKGGDLKDGGPKGEGPTFRVFFLLVKIVVKCLCRPPGFHKMSYGSPNANFEWVTTLNRGNNKDENCGRRDEKRERHFGRSREKDGPGEEKQRGKKIKKDKNKRNKGIKKGQKKKKKQKRSKNEKTKRQKKKTAPLPPILQDTLEVPLQARHSGKSFKGDPSRRGFKGGPSRVTLPKSRRGLLQGFTFVPTPSHPSSLLLPSRHPWRPPFKVPPSKALEGYLEGSGVGPPKAYSASRSCTRWLPATRCKFFLDFLPDSQRSVLSLSLRFKLRNVLASFSITRILRNGQNNDRSTPQTVHEILQFVDVT